MEITKYLEQKRKMQGEKKNVCICCIRNSIQYKILLFVLNFVYYGMREYPVSLRVTNTNTRIRVKGINL